MRSGVVWALALLGSAVGCSGEDPDEGETDETALETGGVDTGPSDSGPSDTGGGDIGDTDDGGDTDEDPGPRFEVEDGVWDWMDAVTVRYSANAGDGSLTLDLVSTGGRKVEVYFGGVSVNPRRGESHSLLGTLASDPPVQWTRTWRCGANTPGVSQTAFTCRSSQDRFSEGASGHAVAFAVGLWNLPDVNVDQVPPDDCLLFGRFPGQLLRDPPLDGLTPPVWVTEDCRIFGG